MLVSARKAAFLDRDGVLNALVADPVSGLAESPLRADDVRLLAGVGEGAKSLMGEGYALVCVSNQPAAAKGTVSTEQLWAVHERVVELLVREGVRLDASSLCLHHPEGVVPEYSGVCGCRKPAPGMLLKAAEDLGLDLERSWMIGDTDADVRAGRAAGCRTVLIECAGSAHKRTGDASPDLVASDLADAAARLLDLCRH